MSARALLPASALLMLAACATEGDPTPVLADTEAYLDREVMVSVDDDADGVARMKVQDDFDLREVDRIDVIGVARVAIDDERGVKEVAALLEGDHRVVFAEPNYLAHSYGSQTPNDPYYDYQWNLDQIDVEEAWSYGQGSGTVVAVLDTGVSKSGSDGLTNVLAGYDFYYGDSDPTDRDGHGTFVAGTIAQNTDNGKGVAGVAPQASILPVKVLSDSGYGDINAIANGIVWAADQGADVINMSLGSASSSQTMLQACDYAVSKGSVIVAATGNEFSSRIGYPAAYDSVIAVGASRVDGQRAAYSNRGTGIGLLAPGGDVGVDQNGDGYADGVLQETIERGSWTYTFWEGTSMATPHVAAVAALIMEQGVSDPADVASILYSTATDVGSSGYDTTNGFGLLNAGAAVAMAAGASTGGSSDDGTGGSNDDDNSGDSSGGDSDSGSADTTAPTISSVTGFTQGSQFTVEWITNEAADTYIDFEQYGMFGDDTLTTSHSLTFTAAQGQTYVFDLQSTDAAGNTAVSGSWQVSL